MTKISGLSTNGKTDLLGTAESTKNHGQLDFTVVGFGPFIISLLQRLKLEEIVRSTGEQPLNLRFGFFNRICHWEIPIQFFSLLFQSNVESCFDLFLKIK